MAVVNLYRVDDRKGKVVGVYMDPKTAKIIDHRTDVMYEIADKLEAEGIEESVAEKVAERLIEDRQNLIPLLKSVKDIPADVEVVEDIGDG